MSEVPDEPLEGDIGPAARPASGGAPAAPEIDSAEVLREAEAEREARRRRTNAVSGRIAVLVAALFLAFLTYDSANTAVEAHSKGDDWLYPPATIALVCGAGLIALLTWAWRRRRLGM
ncbi:hypothetical protein E1293_30085 [Actinomadura darangshiensis]|uniref:Uncharacterized protein n=1 Tax=Actinomadura darangshiensis TaxID=705336 RepID=A0A4R5AQQ2_9ACTN|nr:hypothetical protein [Actinomadura darangshiensis]TDD74069.1 hypothetical protein E1293_30085 [Actinomadura darangshiensis]